MGGGGGVEEKNSTYNIFCLTQGRKFVLLFFVKEKLRVLLIRLNVLDL